MPRTFVLTRTTITAPTETESYQDGYENGLTWDRFAPHNNYVPGGPYVSGTGEHWRNNVDPQWIAYCKATRENNEAWLRGWHDARKGVEYNPVPRDHVAVLGYN